jgi:hypothetical protein
MSTYSTISDDYKMFETKALVDYHDDITNHVSVDDMMNHMFHILEEYERCMSEKQEAAVNPMSGRVMMNVGNGLTFELPENIQRIAIAKYLEMKSRGKDVSKCLEQKEQNIENFDSDNNKDGCNENVEEFSECYDKMKKMVAPKIKKIRMPNRKTALTILLIIIIVYATYKYYEENKRPNF